MGDHVHEIGRFFYMVDSHSRPGHVHFVDLEPTEGDGFYPGKGEYKGYCTCEAFHFLCGEPCKHIGEVLAEVIPILRYLDKWSYNAKPKTPPPGKRQYQLKPQKKYDPGKARK